MTEAFHSGIPRDKGWSWMCMIGVHLCMFFVIGTFKSLGILLNELMLTFHESGSLTVWFVGVIACCMSLGAPFATNLASKYSIRAVVVTGSLLSSTGAVLSSFAPNIYVIIVVFGVLTGLGFACLLGPSMMAIGIYFERRRSFANGIAMAGASVGQLALPPLMTWLIKEYTFRGALVIYGALQLNTCVAAMFIRPTDLYRRLDTTESIMIEVPSKPVEKKPSKERQKKERNTGSEIEASTLLNSTNSPALTMQHKPLLRKTSKKYTVPKALSENLITEQGLTVDRNRLSSSLSLKNSQENDASPLPPETGMVRLLYRYLYNRLWGTPEETTRSKRSASSQSIQDHPEIQREDSSDNFFSAAGDAPPDISALSQAGSESDIAKFLSCNSFPETHSFKESPSDAVDGTLVVLKAACNGTQIVSGKIENATLEIVTSTPITVEEVHTSACACGPCTVYSWSLFTKPLFVIYMIACVFGNSSYVDIFIYLPPYAIKDLQLSKQMSAYLLMTTAACDLCGRTFGGWFSDLNFIKRSTTQAVAMMLTGLVCTICAFVGTAKALVGFCVILGFVGGIYCSLYSVVLIDFLGVAKFPAAFGLMVMFQGLFNCPFPSFLGFLADQTKSFKICFYVAGTMLFFSGSVLLLEPYARKHEDKKNMQKLQLRHQRPQ